MTGSTLSTRPNRLTRPNRETTLVAIIAFVVILGLLAAAAVFLRDGTDDVAAGAIDRDGFTASYVSAPVVSGVTHEIALTAAAATTDLGRSQNTNVWSFNGTVPGPALNVQLGDKVLVEVSNELTVATSVHWHGIRVPNDMDGVPGVNQDPILPGESFTYEFTPPDAGTYWYHSHQRGNEQIERGLYGSFVVQDATPKPYSQDIVWMVDDWLLDDSGQLEPDFDSSDDVHHNGRWGSDITVNGEPAPTLQARPGERIRLRLINASNARIYQLRLGELDAVAIAMDGLGVQEPFEAEGLELAPGNRVDLDISIPADASGMYTIGDRFTGIDPLPLGSIEVSGEPVEVAEFDPPTIDVPDWSSAFEWEPTETFDLAIVGEELTEASGLAGDAEGTFRWTINGQSWPEPAVHTATKNQVEKLRFVNDSGAFHPMHLHGQFFQVVARNGQPVREGHYRDTVLLNGGDVVDIVVVPADEGVWALHCHIQIHAEYGMLALYEVI